MRSIVAAVRGLNPTLRAILIFAGLLALMFGDVLTSQVKLLSLERADLATQFAYWRWAGFGEIKAGAVPLWNPYAFSGTPFQASFQSAFFYPVNWVHLILPPVLALNWEIVLNIFLAGLGMYLWSSRSGRSFVASVLSGALLMFGMPYFLRISAGHLAPLGAMAWIPWIFASVDDVLERPQFHSVLRGASVCGLQLLAGHPQTSFVQAIAVGVYCVLRLISSWRMPLGESWPRYWLARLVCLLLFTVGGFGLAAVQLLPSLAATSETLRTHVSYEFASSFSFPPENCLTWLAPSFFGDIAHLDYWGRSYLWEMSGFFGLAGLVLAAFGVMADKPRRWVWIGLLGMLGVLALGGYTPVLRILYAHVPGFDRLRSNSKFSVPAAVVLCLLSAYGYDALHEIARDRRNVSTFRRLCLGACGLAAALSAGAVFLLPGPAAWKTYLAFIRRTHESYSSPANFWDASFIAHTARWAALSLGIAAGTLFVMAGLLWWLRRRPRFFAAFAVFAVAEVFIQAAFVRASFPVSEWYPQAQEKLARERMTDSRILNTTGSNAWMLLKKYAAWGYDPFILRRYAEVMAVTQGIPASDASYDINITHYHPLMKMLRCQFVGANNNGAIQYGELPPGMPHLALIDTYRVFSGRDAVLNALLDKKFDPARQVILEQRPAIGAVYRGRGTVKLLAQSTDSLDIGADLATPQILLITDSYARGWRVESLDGDSQKQYELLPANWTLRAVPLQAGHHHIRLIYAPPSWRAGVWLSLLSLGLLTFACVWRRHSERSLNDVTTPGRVDPTNAT